MTPALNADLISELVRALLRDDPETFELTLAVRRADLPEDVITVFREAAKAFAASSRRRALLQAVMDSATDLAALQRTGPLVARIVQRTRALIGSDMAYLSLNDSETDETYIIESDGVATEEFRRLRLPLGTGLLGAIATSNGPSQTSDYHASRAFKRTEDIDSVVSAEGAKSFLGAPIRFSDHVRGALMVANRSAYEFTAVQVETVEALARIAAVGYNNARQFEGLTQSVDRLQTLLEEREAEVRQLVRRSKADELILNSLSSWQRQRDFVAQLAELLGCELWILDSESQTLPLGFPPEFENKANNLTKTSFKLRAPASAEVTSLDGTSRTMTVMAAAGESYPMGSLVALGRMAPEDDGILLRAGHSLAAQMQIKRSAAEFAYRAQGELIEDIASGRPQRDELTIIEDLHSQGLSPLQLACVVIETDPNQQAAALKILRRKLTKVGIVAPHEGHICCVLNSAEPENFARTLINSLSKLPGSVSAGVAGPTDLPTNFGSVHRSAAIFCHAMTVLGKREVGCQATLGSIGLLLSVGGRKAVLEMIDAQLGKLLRYDEERNGQLVPTALAFMDSNFNIPRTAESLFIHVNTVRQRIERIDEILGSDWRSGQSALDYHISLRVWTMWQE